MRTFNFKPIFGQALGLIVLVGAAAESQALNYHTVDLSAVQNYRLQNMDGAAYQIPTGLFSLADGTPFYIPNSPKNAYLSAQPSGGGERSAEVAIHLWGAVEADTLINSWWGTRSAAAYAYLEFRGSAGAYYRFDLVGNRDIRDYLLSDYTNTINGTSTRNALTISEGRYWQVRLDAQRIALPEEFRYQMLETMRLVDRGDTGLQRTFLGGVTVGIVPEPSTLIGLFGALGLMVRQRTRSKAARRT